MSQSVSLSLKLYSASSKRVASFSARKAYSSRASSSILLFAQRKCPLMMYRECCRVNEGKNFQSPLSRSVYVSMYIYKFVGYVATWIQLFSISQSTVRLQCRNRIVFCCCCCLRRLPQTDVHVSTAVVADRLQLQQDHYPRFQLLQSC